MFPIYDIFTFSPMGSLQMQPRLSDYIIESPGGKNSWIPGCSHCWVLYYTPSWGDGSSGIPGIPAAACHMCIADTGVTQLVFY